MSNQYWEREVVATGGPSMAQLRERVTELEAKLAEAAEQDVPRANLKMIQQFADMELERNELRAKLAAVRNLLAEGLFVYSPSKDGPGQDVDETATIKLLEQALGDDADAVAEEEPKV